MSPVFRIESAGEAGIPYPSLASAMAYVPSHRESQIATSIEGVVLAEAESVNGPGTMLRWVVTLAGQDILDRTGWTMGMPVLSEPELSTVLLCALAEDLKAAS